LSTSSVVQTSRLRRDNGALSGEPDGALEGAFDGLADGDPVGPFDGLEEGDVVGEAVPSTHFS